MSIIQLLWSDFSIIFFVGEALKGIPDLIAAVVLFFSEPGHVSECPGFPLLSSVLASRVGRQQANAPILDFGGGWTMKHPKNWETALWGKVRLYWKKGFIERKALLKERLYWKKGLIETNSKIWSKFQNLVQVLKFGWKSEIWPNIWNLAKNVKFGGNSEIWLKLWNLVNILKFSQTSEIW